VALAIFDSSSTLSRTRPVSPGRARAASAQAIGGQEGRQIDIGEEQQVGKEASKQVFEQLIVSGHGGTYLLAA
jgi:hypothetical protein